MFFKAISAVAGLSLACTGAAQAQDIAALDPATPWALDYAQDSCRLVRTFGSGADEVTLGLTSYEPGGRFVLSAVGEPTRTFRTPLFVEMAIGQEESFKVGYIVVDFGGRPGILILNPITVGQLPAEAMQNLRSRRPVASYSDPAVEERVTDISFIDGFEREFRLNTGSLREPMSALKECTVELATHWGDNLPAPDSLSRIASPASAPFRWLNVRGYPREMRRPMLINYRLTVEADGSVSDCHVADVEPDSEFARLTCEQLRDRARLDPALDADGNPVRSTFVFWHAFRSID